MIWQEFASYSVTKNDDDSRRIEAFSKLDLFLPIFPGNLNPGETDSIDGLVEMNETFVRSLQFFWPRDKIRFTGVLDDTTYSNDKERDDLITKFKSYFDDDLADNVSIKFNPRTGPYYGRGWHLQQLIQLWADNYTDSEYIGYVDDDTLFTSAVYPYDLFDEKGRPRITVHAADDTPQNVIGLLIAPEISYKFKPRFYSMVNFPVLVKREHLAKMREVMLANNPEYSYFDELFHYLVFRGKNRPDGFCQFNVIVEYLYEYHREEYSWHLEMPAEKQIEFSTPEMYEPLPRITIHANYIYPARTQQMNYFKTLGGRRVGMVGIMREGYCYSLLSWNNTDRNHERCKQYDIDNGIHVRGEWKFETLESLWLSHPNVSLARAKRRQHQLVDHVWDEVELNNIFGS